MKRQDKLKMMWSRVAKTATYSKMEETDQSSTLDLNGKNSTQEKENSDTKPKGLEKSESPNSKVPKKEKKKRKGWKRIRHIALVTCRYIGVGVSYMSPMYPSYSFPEYMPEQYPWYNSAGKNYQYNTKAEQQYFLGAGMLFSGW